MYRSWLSAISGAPHFRGSPFHRFSLMGARERSSPDRCHLGGTLYSACHSNVAAAAVGSPGAHAFPGYEPWPIIPWYLPVPPLNRNLPSNLASPHPSALVV